MADNLVFEESLNTEIDTSEFISKKWVYVNDNNNQNYTSQIVIDSTPLSNAGGWINWSEGFIVMPLVVQLTAPADATQLPVNTSISDYSWAFKNGFWQMINSMTVEFNNQNIVQQTPFLNVFRSFKCLTSWSNDDLYNHGATCGFYPDSSDSWSYCDNFNTKPVFDGNGQNIPLTNNRNTRVCSTTITSQQIAALPAGTTAAQIQTAIQTTVDDLLRAEQLPQSETVGVPTVAPTATTYTYSGTNNQATATNAYVFAPAGINDGMLKRQKDILYNTAVSGTNGSLGQSDLNPEASCASNYRSSKIAEAGAHTWKVYAKLRLKDLADYFEKVPLLKGSTMRFYINTNQAIVSFTSQRAVLSTPASLTVGGQIATNSILAVSEVNVLGGLSNPLMVCSNIVGQGGSAIPAASASAIAFQLSVSIVRNDFTQTNKGTNGSTSLKSCRLYAPVYTMNPIAESKYLSLAPTKRIKYNDVFQYQFNNILQGDNFNFLVSNGINNIKSVLVVPFLSASAYFTNAAGTANTKVAFNSLLSPFGSAPAMPDPIMLTNFNILISGVNLFLNNENYDYEAFLTQLAQSNQLNGNLTTGLTSGLISEKMFNQAYRYYYGNCSRILPSEEGVSRSVQILGQNQSKNTVDIMVFVEFQKEIVVDVATGARIE